MDLTAEEFVRQHASDDLMTLAVERDKLIYEIEEWKNGSRGRRAFEDGEEVPAAAFADRLSDLLAALNELIGERERAEGTTVDKLEYPDGFVDACSKAYDLVGPIYMAEEMLGCWVFRTTRRLTISGPVGVVIATGELVHFHMPSLISPIGHNKAIAKAISNAVGERPKTIRKALCDESGRWPVYRVPSRFQS